MSPEEVIEFIKDNPLFDDDSNLKLSECRYYSEYKGAVGCQGWDGNSGGPVLDSNNKVMAIITRGSMAVGGIHHAEIGVDYMYGDRKIKSTIRINDIKLPETDKK